MREYGKSDYWDDRYTREAADPFDWLVSYNNVKDLISKLIDKNLRILVIGCGNAPFSADLFAAGYHNITNIDLSEVVIQQQMEKHPDQEWIVMDVESMAQHFRPGSFDVVIDKSVADCIMCCSDAHYHVCRMISEIFQVLKPKGQLICFSLHTIQAYLDYINMTAKKTIENVLPANWSQVFVGKVENPRWDMDENCGRNVAHSIIVCNKSDRNIELTDEQWIEWWSSMPCLMSKNSLKRRLLAQREAGLNRALSNASGESILESLDRALRYYEAHHVE